MTTSRRRILVTSAPPNPNGDLHLGHLAGPFLAADVYRRYQRSRGHEVLYISYTDDYNSYVLRKAEDLKWTHAETAMHFSRLMRSTLAWAEMAPDHYMHPLTSPTHRATVQEFFDGLRARHATAAVTLPAFYCDVCARYLYEAEGRGTCPYCGAPSDPNYCEECARPHRPGQLDEAACLRGHPEPRRRADERMCVLLDRSRDTLEHYYATRRWRPPLTDYCAGLLRDGPGAVPISRRYQFGVPVPMPGWEGHVLDTWFAGAPSYIAATQEWASATGAPERWKDFWCDGDSSIVQFLGFDCSFSHAVLYPAMLAAHGGFNLPDTIVTNAWYLLDGEKFSTSRNHAVWVRDLAGRVPSDAVRYYLCLTAPETEPSNFTLEDFHRVISADLGEGLDRWIGPLTRFVAAYPQAVTPAAGGDDVADKLFLESRTSLERSLDASGFSLRGAAKTVQNYVRVAGRLWHDRMGAFASATADSRAHVRLASALRLAVGFAVMAEPLLPTVAARLARTLTVEPLLREPDRWLALDRALGPVGVTAPWTSIFELGHERKDADDAGRPERLIGR